MKKLFFVLLAALPLTTLAQDAQQLAREITTEVDVIDATLPQINILIKKGEKGQAKTLIEKSIRQIEAIEANYKQLAQMGEPEDINVPPVTQLQETKRYLTGKLNQVRYTNVYIRCEAKLFDGEYGALLDEVQSVLSESDVSFVDSVCMSDWAVTITAEARE